ncbi:MAG: radical SAM protein [Anaerohalosphaera sp.]|nr:radical SAM protein [Anaerohalosphaera sp.]
MTENKKILFGPVPSRRLGLSLGVDLVPLKTCTQNCLYCQLGMHAKQTTVRKPYVDINTVLAELRQRIADGLVADYITLSGSGEPTLNSDIGILIDHIKQITDIPVAVITNGTLLNDPRVRADCAKADLVLPSLDAGDQETFDRMNNPASEISFDDLTRGLEAFRTEYTGRIWLELFFCMGINTSDEQIARMKKIVDRISPDRIQLNTAVRPTADAAAKIVPLDQLESIARQFGSGAEVIADFARGPQTSSAGTVTDRDIIEMLKRRPCSLADISAGLQTRTTQLTERLEALKRTGEIVVESRMGKAFYKLPE